MQELTPNQSMKPTALFRNKFSVFDLLPAKEDPSVGRLELRLLFFASLISPPFLRIPFLREPRKSVKGLFRALPDARGESRRTSTKASSKSGKDFTFFRTRGIRRAWFVPTFEREPVPRAVVANKSPRVR